MDLIDGLIFDAIGLRLIEIGEAVKRICPELLQTESDIPWEDIAGMRDCLAHRVLRHVSCNQAGHLGS